jgi:hypothetical protein
MLDALRWYVDEHGWRDFRSQTVFDGLAVGTWAVRRRAEFHRGRFPGWLRRELESLPEWTWAPIKDRHRRQLDLLQSFVRENGWDRLNQQTRVGEFRIGAWACNLRRAHRLARLPAWLKEELEAIPGWQWSIRS